jgi:hypothetical protein
MALQPGWRRRTTPSHEGFLADGGDRFWHGYSSRMKPGPRCNTLLLVLTLPIPAPGAAQSLGFESISFRAGVGLHITGLERSSRYPEPSEHHEWNHRVAPGRVMLSVADHVTKVEPPGPQSSSLSTWHVVVVGLSVPMF